MVILKISEWLEANKERLKKAHKENNRNRLYPIDFVTFCTRECWKANESKIMDSVLHQIIESLGDDKWL